MKLLSTLSFSVAAFLSMATVSALPVAQIVRLTDTSGNPVSGATLTIGGTALTAGAATTVSGKNIDTGAALTSPSVTYYDFADGSGQYSVIYDPGVAQGHFTVTATKSGTTIANSVFGVNFYADPSTIALTNAQTTASNQTQSDYNALNMAGPGSPTTGSTFALIASMQANFTTILSRIPQTVLFDPSGYVKANSYVLPVTVPSGYGGGTSNRSGVH